MTSVSLPHDQNPGSPDPTALPAGMQFVIQIVGTVFFGIFAITATALAFDAFWPAGLVVAVVIVLRGFGPLFGRRTLAQARTDAQAAAPHMPQVLTGNASFDAYRAEVLQRLEDERVAFLGFLDRLREAKDKTEFDRFLSDRARAVQAPTGNDPAPSGTY